MGIGINIPENVEKMLNREVKLHQKENHPLKIVSQKVKQLFPDFYIEETFNPRVSLFENFDSLRIPENHPSRSLNDTFYLDNQTVLRTHTSAHQNKLLQEGYDKFLVIGDVYRKDTIDSTHYPVFHQVEGVCLTDNPEEELKKTLEKVITSLFPNCEWRLSSDYFPFTEPSYEVEVLYNGEWLEILGCGVIHPEVLEKANVHGKQGWAFGFGLERLAMILFNIPDIRLFWTEDSRFLSQFKEGEIAKFEPYSKHPACYKDIAFWIGEDYHPNNFYEIVRSVGGDSVESIEEIDRFSKKGRTSLCYRINFRHLDRTLTNEEVNVDLFKIHDQVKEKLNVELRV